MKYYLLPTALCGSILLAICATPGLALSPVEVQRIAKQTTIEIVGCAQGSGVIIQKEGNTYTVLTVAHVVKSTGCELVTPDDVLYPVTQVKLFPNRVDLAVVKFTSNTNYPVAKLIDNSDRVEAGETIYVSGFPVSTAINTSVFTFDPGNVFSNSSTRQQGKGYSLIYSNNTLPGHSGGPVWNDKGELIAIHGQGDVDTKLQETANNNVRIKTGFNLGITVNTFTNLASAVGLSGYTPVVVAAKPKPVDDLIASAILKNRQGDYRGILADLNRAISLDRQNARAYSLRGAAKFILGDRSGAMADHQRAIALDPHDARAYNNRGNAKSGLGKNQEAIEDYNHAIFLNPNLAQAYSNRGGAKLGLGNKQGALADLTRAIALDPNYFEAYNNRGILKFDLGDKQGGLDDYHKAIAVNPKYAKAYNNRGIAKSNLGDNQGAIEDYNRAIALNPKYAEAYNNRGVAKSDLGDNQGAIEDYNRAIMLNPDYAKAYSNRSNAKFSLKDNKGAIADSNRAIALDPKYAQAYYNRGNAKSDLGNKQGALADYNRAIALDPKHVKAYYDRGAVKSASRNKQGAIADWRKAAELYKQKGQTFELQRVIAEIERLGDN